MFLKFAHLRFFLGSAKDKVCSTFIGHRLLKMTFFIRYNTVKARRRKVGKLVLKDETAL